VSVKRGHVCESFREHVCVHSEKHFCPHISAALPVHTVVISYYCPLRTAGGGRKGGEELAVTRVPRRSPGSWNLTCVCCQCQATAKKAYNLVSAISRLSRWTLVSFVTSGKLAGWSVPVYNTHPNFERGNCGDNCAYYNRIFAVHLNVAHESWRNLWHRKLHHLYMSMVPFTAEKWRISSEKIWQNCLDRLIFRYSLSLFFVNTQNQVIFCLRRQKFLVTLA